MLRKDSLSLFMTIRAAITSLLIRGCMKYSYQIFLLTSGLLILMTLKEPSSFQNRPNSKKQMMEEVAGDHRRFHVEYKIQNDRERKIADILWLKKVARLSLELGVSGFNILEEQINPHSVEGVIELEEDRMSADYDSYEILELNLPEL